MRATPENYSVLSSQESSQPNLPHLCSAILNRNNLNYAATVGTIAYLNQIGAEFMYKLNYPILEKLYGASSSTVLDQFRDPNWAASVIGGIVGGHVAYWGWKKTRPYLQ